MFSVSLIQDLTCEPECFQPATASSPALSKPVDDFSHSRTGSTESNQLPRTNTNTSAIPFPTERYPTTNSSDFNTPVMSSMRPNDENPPLRYMETRGNVGGEGQIHNETPRHTPEAADDFNDNDGPIYQVHGGMLRLARAMGSKGKPVHDAVSTALSRNRGYGESWKYKLIYTLMIFRACLVRTLTRCWSCGVARFGGYMLMVLLRCRRLTFPM